MASEINVLAHELNRISELNRRTRDFTLNSLRRALVEFIALLPGLPDLRRRLAPELDDARRAATSSGPSPAPSGATPTTNAAIFDFLRDILLRRYPEHLDRGRARESCCASP